MATNENNDVQGFDDAPRPLSKKKKIWIGAGVSALALIAGAGLIIPQFLDQAKYKALIQQKVADATGYTVNWEGDLGISVLPLPSVSMKNLTLANGVANIISLKEADVRVALMPLLDQRVEISSVNLVEPDVTLIVDKQGNSTWLTDKLSAKSDAQISEPTSREPETNSAPAITLDALKITNGRLTFRNEQTGAEQRIENLNANVSADSLNGPYAAKGDVVYDQKKVAFDVKAGQANNNEYPLEGEISLPELNVDGQYSGIIASSPLKVDGDLTFAAKDLGKTIGSFTGDKPEIPEGLDGEASLKSKVFYNGKDASLTSMRITAGDLAYMGSIAVRDLASNAPPLTIDLVPEKNSVQSDSALVAILNDLSVKGTGTYANNRVKIDNGNIQFRGQQVGLSGIYAMPSAAGQRPNIDFTIKANKIDLDQLTGSLAAVNGGKSSSAKESSEKKADSPKGMSLPFDGRLQADIGTFVSGGKAYSPLKADVVSKGNALTINNLNVGTVADSTITAKGRVGNLAELSDFDINASLKTADAEALMKSFNLEAPAIEQKLGAASVSGNFKGSLDKVAFDATANALKFAVTGQGTVTTPLTNYVITSLRLNVEHPQLSEAVRTFQPGFDAPPSFRGPLDLSTTVSWDKNEYALNDISGSLGGTNVNGMMNLSMGEKPAVKGSLTFGDLVFDATRSKGGGAGASSSSSPASSSDGRWSREPINTAWMRSFDADLAIKAKSVTQDLWRFSNVNLSFALSEGTLSLRDASAGLFGGQAVLNGQVKSGATEREPLSTNVVMTASNLDARQLQSALTGKQSDTLNGKVSNFKLDVNSTGLSPATLVQALNGTGVTEGQNIIIKGIDAAQLAETAKGSFKPLERAGSLFQTFQDGQTQFDTMNVAMDIRSGVVTFPELKFDGPRAAITGKSGNVNLPRWMIDLTTTVTVKNTDIPPFDLTIKGPLDNPLQAGGNIIEGYLRDKAQKKLEKVIGKELEKRFGIPLGGNEQAPVAPQDTAPASGAEGGAPPAETAPTAPVEKQVTPEEEAIKALQNLLGR